MIAWLVILVGLVTSFCYADLHSDNTVYSLWLPLVFVIFLIAFLLKLVFNFEWARSRVDSGAGDSGYGGGGDGGC